MNNKILYGIIILFAVLIVIGGIYFLSNKTGTKSENGSGLNAVNPAPTPALSEEPNRAKFSEYFSDFYLGSMPAGKKIGADGFPTRTSVFSLASKEQLCESAEVIKVIPVGSYAVAVYDVNAKTYVKPKTVFPMRLDIGGLGGCDETMPVSSAGSYEYKVYLDGVLTAVLPFEVR